MRSMDSSLRDATSVHLRRIRAAAKVVDCVTTIEGTDRLTLSGELVELRREAIKFLVREFKDGAKQAND